MGHTGQTQVKPGQAHEKLRFALFPPIKSRNLKEELPHLRFLREDFAACAHSAANVGIYFGNPIASPAAHTEAQSSSFKSLHPET